MSAMTIHALIRPLGMCYELLTEHAVEKYILPVLEIVPTLLEKHCDNELKKDNEEESMSNVLLSIAKLLKRLAGRAPGQENTIKSLEMCGLKMILRMLQTSSFKGKMDALREVNAVISNMTYVDGEGGGGGGRCGGGGGGGGGDDSDGDGDGEWLTADRMVEWMKENKVLQIALRDSLDQPRYVEKLEKVIRFLVKEKALTLGDLDSLWAAQSCEHQASIMSVHDLLAKLACDFSPEQLDQLFGRMRASWQIATENQSERIPALMVRLAEDDKDGVMAAKVLDLLWSLTNSDDVPTEIREQALSVHEKILENNSSQRTKWLERCVQELKSDKWGMPALKQIRNICLGEEEHTQDSLQHGSNKHEIISLLQSQHSFIIVITENLAGYMEKIRALTSTNSSIDVNTYCPDGWYSHMQQIQERLNLMYFILKGGQLWLCSSVAHWIWSCLVERAVFPSDREVCFKWFSGLMDDDTDLDPDSHEELFRECILQLDPALLTESGFSCFDKFFKAVNKKTGRLLPNMEDKEPIGVDYLWRMVENGGNDIANMAKELLRETYSGLRSQPRTKQECGICLRPWGEEVRRALVLPCRHAYGCLACMKQVHAEAGREGAVCPFCRGPFNEPPEEVFL